VVALEVAASETPKVWRGSIAVLEEVSLALGILLLQDEQMRRRLVREGVKPEIVDGLIADTLTTMRTTALRARQRIQVMTMAELRYQHRVYEEHGSREVQGEGKCQRSLMQ
jgi:hypothetical protein